MLEFGTENKEITVNSPSAPFILSINDNVYQIFFERYIIYQCRNESYTAYDVNEIRKGNYLIIFEHSRLLDYYKDVIYNKSLIPLCLIEN